MHVLQLCSQGFIVGFQVGLDLLQVLPCLGVGWDEEVKRRGRGEERGKRGREKMWKEREGEEMEEEVMREEGGRDGGWVGGWEGGRERRP